MKTVRSEKEILKQIDEVYSALSPENLSCDGELPMAEQRRRYSKLNKELQNLFKELGRKVGELEVYEILKVVGK